MSHTQFQPLSHPSLKPSAAATLTLRNSPWPALWLQGVFKLHDRHRLSYDLSPLTTLTYRLDRLVLLLDTGSTAAVRQTAAQQLGEIQKQHPTELYNLLSRVRITL